MKFICDQQILSKALHVVSKAVSARTTIPILKGLLLELKDGYLTISASDLDLSIERKIEVNVLEEGSTVILSKLFVEIIRKLPLGEVTIEKKENGRILIKRGASEFEIAGISAEEFPRNMEGEEETTNISFKKEIFYDMVKKTIFAASIDESKGIITGALVEMEENSTNLVALDGFRMAVRREASKNNEKKIMIIPARMLGEINKILIENEEDEDVTVLLGKKKATFLLKGTKIMVRLLEGEFIKYKGLLPAESNSKIKVEKNSLLESIERAALLAKEGKNNLIKFKIDETILHITSRSEEGNVKEEVWIEKEGINLEIGFNSKYIIDVLKNIDEEYIKIEFNSSIAPCIVKPVEGDGFEYLILPVRIS